MWSGAACTARRASTCRAYRQGRTCTSSRTSPWQRGRPSHRTRARRCRTTRGARCWRPRRPAPRRQSTRPWWCRWARATATGAGTPAAGHRLWLHALRLSAAARSLTDYHWAIGTHGMQRMGRGGALHVCTHGTQSVARGGRTARVHSVVPVGKRAALLRAALEVGVAVLHALEGGVAALFEGQLLDWALARSVGPVVATTLAVAPRALVARARHACSEPQIGCAARENLPSSARITARVERHRQQARSGGQVAHRVLAHPAPQQRGGGRARRSCSRSPWLSSAAFQC